jgi:hypothetical protein
MVPKLIPRARSKSRSYLLVCPLALLGTFFPIFIFSASDNSPLRQLQLLLAPKHASKKRPSTYICSFFVLSGTRFPKFIFGLVSSRPRPWATCIARLLTTNQFPFQSAPIRANLRQNLFLCVPSCPLWFKVYSLFVLSGTRFPIFIFGLGW